MPLRSQLALCHGDASTTIPRHEACDIAPAPARAAPVLDCLHVMIQNQHLSVLGLRAPARDCPQPAPEPAPDRQNNHEALLAVSAAPDRAEKPLENPNAIVVFRNDSGSGGGGGYGSGGHEHHRLHGGLHARHQLPPVAAGPELRLRERHRLLFHATSRHSTADGRSCSCSALLLLTLFQVNVPLLLLLLLQRVSGCYCCPDV